MTDRIPLTAHAGVGAIQKILAEAAFYGGPVDKLYGCDTHLALRKAISAARQQTPSVPAVATLEQSGPAVYAMWLQNTLGLTQQDVSDIHKGWVEFVERRGGWAQCGVPASDDVAETDEDPDTGIGDPNPTMDANTGEDNTPPAGEGLAPEEKKSNALWWILGIVAVAGVGYWLWSRRGSGKGGTGGLSGLGGRTWRSSSSGTPRFKKVRKSRKSWKKELRKGELGCGCGL